MKAFRHKLNPKNIRDAVRRRGHNHDKDSDDDANSDDSAHEISVDDSQQSQSAAGPPPGWGSGSIGAFNASGSGGVSPPNLPPGAKVMTGPPPPGVHVVKMPPGSRPVSPSGTPPAGAKIMSGPPPPGAKIMSGPPPAGVKVMNGPPPGAKIMSGPPPAGAKIMSGPPPAGAKVMSGPPPAGAKVMSGPPPPGVKIMNGPPPGAKIISGPPPPGARIVSSSPPLSRPASPEVRPGSRSPEMQRLPPGAKIIMGSPPPGARLVKSPPAGGFPGSAVSPPASPPLKLMIKSMSRPPSPGQSSPSTPQLNNLSFSKSPPPPGSMLSSPPPAGVLKPTPTVPKRAPAVPPPGKIASPPASAVSSSKKPETLQIPRPSSFEQQQANNNNDESIVLEPESSESNIDFVVDSKPASPVVTASKAPVKKPEAPKRQPSPSSTSEDTSSSMFKEEADLVTALPAPRSVGSPQSAMSKDSSMRSSVPKTVSSAKGSSTQHAAKPPKASKPAPEAPKTKSAAKSKPKKAKSSADSGSHTPSQRLSRTPSSMPSPPAEVDHTKRRTPQMSPSVASTSEDVAAGGAMALGALRTEALTPALRTKIADQFLSILCPQQYYGKVKKLSTIRPIQADRRLAQGLKNNNSIYVATKGESPNPCFFPQLRLLPADAVTTSSSDATVSTPVILYEAAPGRMLFADTELEGRRLLGTNATADSCFVLSTSSILFRDPAQYVLPVATLTVEWTPYASAGSEPQCPIHKKELQLFDPYSKELVCALCASKQADTAASRLVVIPDVLSGDSRNRIQTSLTKQLDEAQRSAKLFVGQHQRIAQMQESKKVAVSQQFDMLLAAIESKRKEYLEACDAEYGYAMNDVAREILVSDEKVQLLAAATDHLRSDSTTKPLYSMQIATVAEALTASRTFPAPFAKSSLRVPTVSSGVMPNLEGVMAELQALNPSVPTGTTASTPNRRLRASTAASARGAATSPRRRPDSSHLLALDNNGVTRARSVGASPQSTPSPRRAQQQRMSSSLASASRSRPLSPSNGLVRSPRRAPPSPPLRRSGPNASVSPRGQQRRVSPQSRDRGVDDISDNVDDDGVALTGRTSRGGIMSVPNSTGTSLFDFPLQELLAVEEAEEACRPHAVQWSFRVDDPGDWVGIGVGVGSTIDAWERSSRNDLSHLWIVPYAGRRQTFLLRVTVNSAAGHAKLTIHDIKGRQLDDGAIPQWNASRISYPQVTFGGRVGQVRMLDPPALV